jgi:hypothetical protein
VLRGMSKGTILQQLSTFYSLLSTELKKIKAYGQLVLLGFDVTTFTKYFIYATITRSGAAFQPASII